MKKTTTLSSLFAASLLFLALRDGAAPAAAEVGRHTLEQARSSRSTPTTT